MNHFRSTPFVLITSLLILTACGGGGGGSGGGSDGDGGSTWTGGDQLLTIDAVTLEGTLDETASIVVNGETLTAAGTSFRVSDSPSALGIANALIRDGQPIGPVWRLLLTDADGQSNQVTVAPVFEP